MGREIIRSAKAIVVKRRQHEEEEKRKKYQDKITEMEREEDRRRMIELENQLKEIRLLLGKQNN